ncbi:fatty acyl-AMP ligase [Vacuolonema iberomarrocanum]|uniref:fatty acyl-AMP ligase n=1 Tax=Vacuolonema iberomarrocanum TaxID=3454632 RepID=UPI0019E38C86|nr:fatty acyl-AMP ligase [filamentous cyanobacterium LEGE 07170]
MSSSPLPLHTSGTFVERLRSYIPQQADAPAFIFLKNGETEAVRFSYGELDRRARAIATTLQTQVAAWSDAPTAHRALLVYPYEGGAEFVAAFLGCLYAGVVAVPCAAPRHRTGWMDLRDRLESAAAKLILTSTKLLPTLKKQLANPAVEPFWLTTDAALQGKPDHWKVPDLTGENLAFLQYTSGSTGKPKGVCVTHRAILQNQRMIQEAFGHDANNVGVGWLPLFHDMGLIGNVLQPLYLGSYSVLMSPIDFVQKPVRWLQAVSRYGAITSGGPNFAYDLLCDRVSADQRADLDLSRWQVAFSGAEPVLADTIERFSKVFGECGFRSTAFYPCYGMAEATLFITGGEANEAPVTCTVDDEALEQNRVQVVDGEAAQGRSLISCGQPRLDGRIVIADPQTGRPCALDEVGEIWVAGSGLGTGYWNREELSDRTFRAHLDTGEGPFLRTGDLGFLHDDNLFITGRLNDVLVFWGLNHYPQHIEQTVTACHPGFRPNGAAAFSVEVNGARRLVVAQEVERRFCTKLTLEEVLEPLRWQVFHEHFIDLYGIVLLKPGGLPRTSSGKLQRQRCREQFVEGKWEPLAEWRSPHPHAQNMTDLVEHYFNPMTHLRRTTTTATARLKRLLSHIKSG